MYPPLIFAITSIYRFCLVSAIYSSVGCAYVNKCLYNFRGNTDSAEGVGALAYVPLAFSLCANWSPFTLLNTMLYNIIYNVVVAATVRERHDCTDVASLFNIHTLRSFYITIIIACMRISNHSQCTSYIANINSLKHFNEAL